MKIKARLNFEILLLMTMKNVWENFYLIFHIAQEFCFRKIKLIFCFFWLKQ